MRKPNYWEDYEAYYRSVLSLSPIEGEYLPTKEELAGEWRFLRQNRTSRKERYLFLKGSKL